ncbi:MAG: SLBB domain-containing protein, partial [Spirochaetaceae bacterium]|nr:SLBB domain-containing protein [Spirochaetaceae bacterium]
QSLSLSKKDMRSLMLLNNESSVSAETKDISMPKFLTTGQTPSVQLAMSTADYMITAGDIYSLSFVAGTSPVTYTIPVDSSYKIRVANLAVLDATGKTFVAIKKQVEDIVSKNFPMSAVQFTLLSPATFSVRITGEVTHVTEQNAWTLNRLSDVLGATFTDFSSIRNITVKSINGKEKTYDLFAAIRFGDMSQNPYLRPGDVITVAKVNRSVTIEGAVQRPGVYELLEGENFKNLVEYYGGGLAPFADTSRIEVTRYNGLGEDSNKAGQKFYWNQSAIDENREMFAFDSVTISTYTALQPVVFIEGAIVAPETIEASKSEKNSSVIETMKGNPDSSSRRALPFVKGSNYGYFIRSNKDLFTAVSDTANAYVIRKGEIISLDVSKILYDSNFDVDLLVEPNDVLHIPFQKFTVTVAGSVNKTGEYPYVPNKTYEYYIGLAGGFKTSENMGKSVVIMDVNGNRINKNDIITPDTIILAKTNSFMYWWTQYAPIITTVSTLFTAVSTGITLYTKLK